ncbi:Semaphorin-6A [Liparis tanakae]|uniref:Semaphorin-6A n=1 Tax=Liparis tanakae TaxID=230148 RepID=A0A4Z2EHX1_9TELE|nr:Semaphorin-6A [Liparis tanakae]
MAEVANTFTGRFKEQKSQDSTWTAFPEDRVPKPRRSAGKQPEGCADATEVGPAADCSPMCYTLTQKRAQIFFPFLRDVSASTRMAVFILL